MRPMLFGLLTSVLVSGQQLIKPSHVSGNDPQVMKLASHIPDDAKRIWENIKSDAMCLGCQGIILLMKQLASLGNDAFVSTLQQLCKAATSEDDDVCDGSIALQGPVLADSLRQIRPGSHESQMLCASLMGLCKFPAVSPYKVPVPASRPVISESPRSTAKLLKIAHFSDIHIDPLYTTGANTNCSKPMCCRPYGPDDEPGNNDSPAGPFGDHNCAAPFRLEASMYDAVQKLQPDFAIFTGDIVDHAIWNTTVSQNAFEITSAYQHMVDAGIKQVYGTVGNHEQHPTNAIPPSHLDTGSVQWLYNLVGSIWTKWIGSVAEVKLFGAYSVQHKESNLRIISISTNMYYTLNFWLYQDIRKDPSDQFSWLVGELDAAEKAGERVYIVGHMPMGNPDALYDGSNYFDQIVKRYKDTIAAMFFGHTHLDHFQISYTDYKNRRHDNAIATSYIAPSMTPLSGMPAFRIYTVHPTTYAIMDVENFYADMANPDFQQGPVWTKYYSAREAYGPLVNPPLNASDALSPAFWHNVTERFETDPAAFSEYWERRTRGWNVAECGNDCRALEICQLRAARSEDNCFVPVPGGGLGIRSENSPGLKVTKCDRSIIVETLSLLSVRKAMIQRLEDLIKEQRAKRI